MTAPEISTFPTAPSRLDRPAEFVTEAEPFVAALEGLPAEINAFGTYLNTLDLTGTTPATTTEQLTGTNATARATPDSVAALWEQGSDVASAGAISLGEGGYFAITGTTTITDIDFATDKAGRKAWVKFAGALTLTHNASTLILPGGANITTAAGDTACFVSEGSDAVRCVAYQRASGAALSVRSRTVEFQIKEAALTASEVVGHFMPPSGETWVFPANLTTSAGIKIGGGSNPASTYNIDVQKNGVSVATVTISTSGAVTFATSGGASFSLIGGTDYGSIVGPATADTAIGYIIALVATY